MNARQRRAPPRPPIVEAAVEAGESTGEVGITAVGAVSDTAVTTLPPLYGSLDPDELGSLFSDSTRDGNVAFTYNGFLVVVTAPDSVRIDEPSS